MLSTWFEQWQQAQQTVDRRLRVGTSQNAIPMSIDTRKHYAGQFTLLAWQEFGPCPWVHGLLPAGGPARVGVGHKSKLQP